MEEEDGPKIACDDDMCTHKSTRVVVSNSFCITEGLQQWVRL